MKITWNGLTDKGSVREANEDSVYLNGDIVSMQDNFQSAVYKGDITGNVLCFAVADGMGGHEAGEIASRMTLEMLSDEISRNGARFLKDPELIKTSITGISGEINRYAASTAKWGMGTTLVGLIFNDEKFFVYNVGDSRVYILRDGYLSQKTRDHSLVQQVGGNAPKNLITSSIGGGSDRITVDIFDLTGKVRVNDLFIICSDGLTDFDVDKFYDEFELLINENKNDLSLLNKSLFDYALKQGSADNISVISIMVTEE